MDILTILVVGANGSIGRHVVAQALEAGHVVRALVRRTSKALPVGAGQVIGDLTDPASLVPAVDGVDAIIFTHGSDGEGKVGARTVDYGGVRNILAALPAGAHPRIALMTAIGVTDRVGRYNRETEAHDWKRRAERLVRASGLAYTIVRPGWFDYNKPDEMRIVMLQGDRRHAGDSSDGVIARSQIGQVLLASLTCDDARGRSFELVAERGPGQADLASLFAALQPDDPVEEDGPGNLSNMPLSDEPADVLADLASVRAR